jgi:electron transfer flavoprotein beta subunit
MKILVCLKQVPHKDARLELASDGKWIQDANIKFEINDYDNYALEEALRVKDKDAATEVVVICLGPDRVQQSLRTALGMGADRAIQVSDDGLAGADSLAVAKTIAAVAKAEADLVLMGLMSDDTNYALTGPMLAELLGVPRRGSSRRSSTAASRGGARARRRRARSREAALPYVLTAQTGMNGVRYASLEDHAGEEAAARQEVARRHRPPRARSRRGESKIYQPPKGRAPRSSRARRTRSREVRGQGQGLGLL